MPGLGETLSCCKCASEGAEHMSQGIGAEAGFWWPNMSHYTYSVQHKHHVVRK